MARIEGIRIRNYRSLKDVTLGKLSSAQSNSLFWPLPGQLKHEWADKIGPFLCEDRNASPSFKKFCEGVRGLVDSQARK